MKFYIFRICLKTHAKYYKIVKGLISSYDLGKTNNSTPSTTPTTLSQQIQGSKLLLALI